MSASLTLRPANETDLEAISSLLRANGLPLDGVSDCIEDFIVADLNGEIVGSIAIERYDHYGLLRSAAVSTSARGKGIGATLVQRILDDAKRMGVTDVYLLTETAQDYFPRFGFDRIDRSVIPPALNESAELKGACCLDSAIAMRRSG